MVEGIKHLKCPVCGFSYFKNYKESSEITNLLSVRSKKIQSTILKISRLIADNVPTDKGRKNYFYFLLRIKEVDDITVNWGIEQFFKGRHYQTGKGYRYLSSIITNRGQNLTKISENERKMIGSSPPIINEQTKECQ